MNNCLKTGGKEKTMHMDCDIIRDLLPLYEDGALSESGARAVSGAFGGVSRLPGLPRPR